MDLFRAKLYRFFLEREQTAFMDFPFPCSRPCRFFSRATLLALTLLASSLGSQADTRFSIGTKSAAGCYCHCAMSKAHGGCVKICETPKYASRWWATAVAAAAEDAGG